MGWEKRRFPSFLGLQKEHIEMIASTRFLRAGAACAALAASGLASAATLSCSVRVDYVMSAQDGTVIATEIYQKDFLAQPGVPFEDDFSTPTRLKLFTATTTQSAGRMVVAISYFNDVSTFNSIDFDTQLTLVSRERSEAVSGSHTFSTSLDPLSGHYTARYTLTCMR
jgi:hypothetical protein